MPNEPKIESLICMECGSHVEVDDDFSMDWLEGKVCAHCQGVASKVFMPVVKEATNAKQD